MLMISTKVIGRLSFYRRLLKEAAADGTENMFSHELAALAGATPAQVRRDVMTIGYTGSPARGYHVEELRATIDAFLDTSSCGRIALAGVGNLGRALLSYFVGKAPQFSIAAGFDNDPAKVNRVVHGCRCYPMGQVAEVVAREGIRLALVAVPAGVAQDVAGELCRAGVTGILNFAPVRVWVPDGVYVENVDMSMSLERVAYFARNGANGNGKG